MKKKFKIITGFIDIYTNEVYSENQEPVFFNEDRVKEIRLGEKKFNCKFIEELDDKKQNQKKEN